MGLGKTLQVIALLWTLLKQGPQVRLQVQCSNLIHHPTLRLQHSAWTCTLVIFQWNEWTCSASTISCTSKSCLAQASYSHPTVILHSFLHSYCHHVAKQGYVLIGSPCVISVAISMWWSYAMNSILSCLDPYQRYAAGL